MTHSLNKKKKSMSPLGLRKRVTHSAAGFDKPAGGQFQSAGGFDIHHPITYICNILLHTYVIIGITYVRNNKTIFFFFYYKKK